MSTFADGFADYGDPVAITVHYGDSSVVILSKRERACE
jgi:hypothetical protein